MTNDERRADYHELHGVPDEQAVGETTNDELKRLRAINADLLAALEACELAMDTAAVSGVGEILAPEYRDSWAAAHTAARRLLTKLKGA